MNLCEAPRRRLTTRLRVLVVEDEESMQDYYRYFFEVSCQRKFGWVLAATAERALEFLREEAEDSFDVVILDWGLPRMSGMELLGRLRNDPVTSRIPIVMVSSRSDLDGRVGALDGGADDYITKPFEHAELAARLRSILRRASDNREAVGAVKIQDLELDESAHSLTISGVRVRLTPIESGLLGIFMRRPDVIHSNTFLWDTLWGNNNPNLANILQVTISRLRKKLGPRWGPRLEAYRGCGYLLNSKSSALP